MLGFTETKGALRLLYVKGICCFIIRVYVVAFFSPALSLLVLFQILMIFALVL